MEYLIIEYSGFDDKIRFYTEDIKAERGTEAFDEIIEGYEDTHNTILVVPINEHTKNQIRGLFAVTCRDN